MKYTGSARSIAAAALAATILSGCSSQDVQNQPPTSSQTAESSAPAADGGTAQAQLDALPVKGKAPKTGYNRDQFGPAWKDVDHNGCDTRNDVLRRDLTDLETKPGTHECKISSGRLEDPYTGTEINFTAGRSTSSKVQIDHSVALSNAWQTGAQQLSIEEREQLANDPLNLLAVDGSANMSKSDGDAATWLPTNKPYRCSYVARQVAVKTAYHLWVTPAEKEAIHGILSTCPNQVEVTADTPAHG